VKERGSKENSINKTLGRKMSTAAFLKGGNSQRGSTSKPTLPVIATMPIV